jgi:hypothetical protein
MYEELATVWSEARCGDVDSAYNEQLLRVSSYSSVSRVPDYYCLELKGNEFRVVMGHHLWFIFTAANLQA